VKLRRLQHLARAWRDTHPIQSSGIRIDAAAVIVDRTGKITLDYRKAIA
jgi:Holliday junction resolvase-like predicted endonuclease